VLRTAPRVAPIARAFFFAQVSTLRDRYSLGSIWARNRRCHLLSEVRPFGQVAFRLPSLDSSIDGSEAERERRPPREFENKNDVANLVTTPRARGLKKRASQDHARHDPASFVRHRRRTHGAH
jgi:hypothetical protein